MMEPNRIANRIAFTLVLTGLVLAIAGAGTFGPTAGTPQADTAQATGVVTDDRAALFAFPIDNVTASADLSVLAFPIDNVTAMQGVYGIPSDVVRSVRDVVPFALVQDVDPSAPGQDMDPY